MFVKFTRDGRYIYSWMEVINKLTTKRHQFVESDLDVIEAY
jgi:hypothetical protein